MKLSVVVPVYNVEKYISRCLESLVRQDLSSNDYEIIVVNDGSPDNSGMIINNYTKLYPQIKQIYKENGGLSSARNLGIEKASGDYIMFVDSDDYISPNCLNTLLEIIVSNNLEYLGFGINIIKNGKEYDYFSPQEFPDNKIISGEEYMSKYSITITSCGHIAKTSVYKNSNLRFIEGIINEDYDFMLRLYSLLSRMSFIDIPVYLYDIKTEGSITSTKTESQYIKSVNSWMITLESLSKWINKIPQDKIKIKKGIELWIDNFKYRAIVNLIKSKIMYKKKSEYIRLYKDLGIFNYSTLTLKGKRKAIGQLIKDPLIAKLLMLLYK